MPETPQLMPSTNGYYDIPKKSDGSIEIWFGPQKPQDVADAAFVLPGTVASQLPCLPSEAAINKTWKPGDIERPN